MMFRCVSHYRTVIQLQILHLSVNYLECIALSKVWSDQLEF